MWREALRVRPGNDLEFLRQYTELLQLYSEAVEELKRIDGLNLDLYLSWEVPVRQLFSIHNLSSSWGSVKNCINPIVINSLAFAADQLGRIPQPTDIEAEELDKLRGEIEQLQKQLIDSKLDRRVAGVLLSQLENVRLALMAYHLRGPNAIRESLAKALGTVHLERDILLPFKDESVLKKFIQVLSLMDRISSAALRVKELASPVFALLK